MRAVNPDLRELNLPGRELYALPYPDFQKAPETCDVSYLAGICIERLKAIRPEGPYLLAGYSMSGLVAYEVACRLVANGDEVPFLGIIDTVPASLVDRCVHGAVGRFGSFCQMRFPRQLMLARVGRFATQISSELLQGQFGRAYRSTKLGWKGAIQHLRHGRSSSKSRDDGCAQDELVVSTWAYMWAQGNYWPKRYQGNVALFTSDEIVSRYPGQFRGWGRLAPDIAEYQIASTHWEIVRRDKALLAEAMRTALRELEG
jgi:thioesterase domain-containing protein